MAWCPIDHKTFIVSARLIRERVINLHRKCFNIGQVFITLTHISILNHKYPLSTPYLVALKPAHFARISQACVSTHYFTYKIN